MRDESDAILSYGCMCKPAGAFCGVSVRFRQLVATLLAACLPTSCPATPTVRCSDQLVHTSCLRFRHAPAACQHAGPPAGSEEPAQATALLKQRVSGRHKVPLLVQTFFASDADVWMQSSGRLHVRHVPAAVLAVQSVPSTAAPVLPVPKRPGQVRRTPHRVHVVWEN